MTALQEALLEATKSAPARASATSARVAAAVVPGVPPWTPEVEAELIRRLERLPLHYPAHLTTSILAPMLNPHIRVPEDEPKLDAVPTLPTLRRDESEDVSELLRAAGARAYVTGEPGTGKSTLLRSIVLTQMRELRGAVGVSVPLIDLAEELPERTLSLPELLAVVVEVCARLYGPVDAELRARLLDRLENDDSTVICADGLDEVPDGALGDRARRAIEALGGIAGAVVVSSRPGPRLSIPDAWNTIEMRPVGNAKRLLELWFPEPGDPRIARALALLQSPGASDIGGSPLLLGFVAFAASFDREFDSLPDLYERYIALTLERIWKATSQHEPDVVTIDHLVHVSRVLAWQMAHGEDAHDPDGDRWREAETLAHLLRTVDRAHREDAARIVQAEGLFTMATAASTRLHTSYRWVHRTVQEHLVAMYLQEREGRDPSAMVDRLLGYLASSSDWRVVVTHVFTRMTPAAQGQLVSRLIDARDDPQYITGEPERLLIHLVELVQEGTPTAAFLMEDARRRGVWAAQFHTDPVAARGALLTAAEGSARIDLLVADEPELRRYFDTDFLRELIARLGREPKLQYRALQEACQALESRQPLAGVFAFLDVIAAGPPSLPRRPWPDELLERMDLAAVSRRISEYGDRNVRWRLVHFFITCLGADPDEFVSPAGPLDQVDVDIVQLVEKKFIGNTRSLGTTLWAAIAGDYGDIVAYVAAKGPAAEAVRGGVERPWAVVGAWEHVLLTGADASGTALVRDEPLTAEEVMWAYGTEWRSDPNRMRLLYRAIAQVLGRPKSVSPAALTELYRKVVCDPDRAEFDYVRTRVDTATIEETLIAAVRVRGFTDIAVEILNQDPTAWTGSGGRLPVVRDYIFHRYDAPSRGPDRSEAEREQHSRDMSQLFYDITTWGARGNIATMPLFPDYFLENSAGRRRTLETLDWQVLSVPENVAWLDRTLMRFHPDFWRQHRQTYIAPLLIHEK